MLSVEDRLAIEDLVREYCWANDGGDAHRVAATFTADGTYDSYGNVHEGREAIKAVFTERIAARDSQPIVNPQHWTSNLRVDGAGDHATAESYFMRVVHARDNGEPRVEVAAWYIDVLQRVDGRWLFLSRTVTRAMPARKAAPDGSS